MTMDYRRLMVGGACLGAVAALACAPARAKDSYPLRELVECSPRGGLPNFLARLRSGGEVKVAYLGGSITSQKGYRVYSREWFQKSFPRARVSEINAAIGGTGSNLGVFRLRHDVLRFKPDLMFVEFAVNDSGTRPADIKKSMEGIIRQTWRELPTCDICYVYTFTHSHVGDMLNGKMHRAASVDEEIADHYSIPSIHMGAKAAALLKDGKLEMKAQQVKMTRVSGDELNVASTLPVNSNGKIPFSRDGVHPYLDTGHRLYMAAIARSMPGIMARGRRGRHVLGRPLVADNWEKAAMIPLDAARRTGPWHKLDPASDTNAKRFAQRVPGLWKGQPGATVAFRFRGTKVSMYDILGPGCGYIEYEVDGRKRESRRMDGYCTYYRLATLGCADNQPNTVHTVRITVLDRKFDKNAVLFERNRHDFRKNPQKYAATDWYVGAIFIIGEMVK